MPVTDKNSLRSIHLARRQAVTPADHAAWSRMCVQKLASLPLPCGVIAGYVPIKSEICITDALAAFAAGGHIVVLPRTSEEQKELLFYRWRNGDDLACDIYGIPAPLAKQGSLVPDILIVPLLAFDRNGHRLGYGAGHYDATLAKLRALKPVMAIGVAFSCQETEAIPAEPFDQRLNAVVTEKEIIQIS